MLDLSVPLGTQRLAVHLALLCVTGTGIYVLSAPDAAERTAFFDGITQQLAQPPAAKVNRKRKATAPPQVVCLAILLACAVARTCPSIMMWTLVMQKHNRWSDYATYVSK